ncbi:MAG: response regulator [Desulforhopalus sp.]
MKNEKILIVDDDKDLRNALVEILEGSNFITICYDSAEAALQHIKEEQPQLAIIDNMMPGMGGMAFMPLLKNALPGIKIIMITAFSTVDNAVTAMKSGADDYLEKPFRRDELLMTVKRNLEELKFAANLEYPGMDEALACLSNQIRRQILLELASNEKIRFMDLTRQLEIKDHTKVNFHLKTLKSSHLVRQDREKAYSITPQGVKIVEYLQLLNKSITA